MAKHRCFPQREVPSLEGVDRASLGPYWSELARIKHDMNAMLNDHTLTLSVAEQFKSAPPLSLEGGFDWCPAPNPWLQFAAARQGMTE